MNHDALADRLATDISKLRSQPDDDPIRRAATNLGGVRRLVAAMEAWAEDAKRRLDVLEGVRESRTMTSHH